MKLKRTVLYVSDNKFMHIIIKDTLRPYNVVVVDVYNGADALKSLKTTQPDLVLSDIDMPGIDGYELCRQIHEMQQHRTLPVVIYSSSESPKDIEKAYDAGAKGYIIKKYHNEILAEKILHFVRQ